MYWLHRTTLVLCLNQTERDIKPTIWYTYAPAYSLKSSIWTHRVLYSVNLHFYQNFMCCMPLFSCVRPVEPHEPR
jgi:hypothetical protein